MNRHSSDLTWFGVVTGCSSPDRGGCSQTCTPVTPRRWQCGCLPGYQLHQDGHRCIATGESYHAKQLSPHRWTQFLTDQDSLSILCSQKKTVGYNSIGNTFDHEILYFFPCRTTTLSAICKSSRCEKN